MITKIINSYDIHINGQLLRIVEQGELSVDVGAYKSKSLLLNEPRGNKYVNLITYKENSERDLLEVTLDSINIIDNKDILLKSFIASLVDRKRIQQQYQYHLSLDDEQLIYRNDELSGSFLYEVENSQDFFLVNDMKIKLHETDLVLEVNNLSVIKEAILDIQREEVDYLVLYNEGVNISVNRNNDIIPYPILEVISSLNKVYQGETLRTLNNETVEINDNKFNYIYRLISNSQFYIDNTDIYKEGFIIK